VGDKYGMSAADFVEGFKAYVQLFAANADADMDGYVDANEAATLPEDLQDNFWNAYRNPGTSPLPADIDVPPPEPKTHVEIVQGEERDAVLKGNPLSDKFQVGVFGVSNAEIGPVEQELAAAAFHFPVSFVSPFEAYDADELATQLYDSGMSAEEIDASLKTINALAGDGGSIHMANWTFGFMPEDGKFVAIHPKGAQDAIILNVSTTRS
jgi:hypothetical protein